MSMISQEKLKEIIVGHRERFFVRDNLIQRDVQNTVLKYIDQKEIILITGIRRAGKSTLMKLLSVDIIKLKSLSENNILYINFDDERLIDFDLHDFELLYECYFELYAPEGKVYFFLDEIQEIAGWEKWANRLYESENVKIFVTGSNASLMSSEVSTSLTGRNRQVIVYPFSFKEFIKFKNFEVPENNVYTGKKRALIRRYFNMYSNIGGFPEVLKIDDVTLLEQYYKDIIYRDIIARYSIRHVKEIRELSLFLASNCATIQSYRNISKMLDIKSINTVKNYIEALQNVYLFFLVDLFDYSVKKQIYNPPKVYCIDNGMINAISFSFSENKGHLLENIVFLSLLRNGYNIYYWKSKSGGEVDFIIKKGQKIIYAIQVAHSIKNNKTKEREVSALYEAKKEIGAQELIIITGDEEGTEKKDSMQIRVIPVWKWLCADM